MRQVSAYGQPRRLDAQRRFRGLSTPVVATVAKVPQLPTVPVARWISQALSPVTPSKIVCIGLNYVDHAEETGARLPTEPVIFLKASTAWAAASRATGTR